jgi:hypothetical protein
VCLEDGKNDVLLARARQILKAERFAKLDELGCRTSLELRQVVLPRDCHRHQDIRPDCFFCAGDGSVTRPSPLI